MRATLALVAFAVAAQAAALPVGEKSIKARQLPPCELSGANPDVTDTSECSSIDPTQPADTTTGTTTGTTTTDNTNDVTTGGGTQTQQNGGGNGGSGKGKNGGGGNGGKKNGGGGGDGTPSTDTTTGGSDTTTGTTTDTTDGTTSDATNDTTDTTDGTTTSDGTGDGSSYSYKYTPYYGNGGSGFKPPPTYPPKYQPPPTSYTGPYCNDPSCNNYQYPQNYPAQYPQQDNSGQKYSQPDDSDYQGAQVSSPSYGESVPCGKPYEIKWGGIKGSKVKIEHWYGTGPSDCHVYAPIVASCDNTGSYTWNVPEDIPQTGGYFGYAVKITCLDTNKVVYSDQCNLKNDDFYNDYKHDACPTSPPPAATVTCEQPIPSATPCETQAAAPAPATETPCETPAPATETPCETPAPASETPCETPAPAAPAAAAVATPCPPSNATSSTPPPPVYTGAASGIKASFSFVAGLAVLVAFAL